MIEVLAAALVLIVGLTAMLGMLVTANHATAANRERQAATSLAREIVEDVRGLSYSQVVGSSLATTLQSLVPGATLSGSGTALRVNRSIYSYRVSFTECSLDDPIDGYGSHSSSPNSGGNWCSDVASSGSTDTNPDDYKRVTVTVTPRTGSTVNQTVSAVEQAVLVYQRPTNGPAVSCLTTVSGSCPGTNKTVTTGSSLTFYATTTETPASFQWLQNGSQPASTQIGSPSTDPFTPSSTSSTFTWNFPTADGTYTISARGYDGNGNAGTQSSLQITLNLHAPIAPTSLTAGWNPQFNNGLGGVDVSWIPSVDQDIKYYDVYHYYGSNPATATLVCSNVKGTSCYDLTALTPNPGLEPTCTSAKQSWTTSDNYYVVGVDTDPNTGLDRIGTAQSPAWDANYCDHQPNAPTGLTATYDSNNGVVNLSWTKPTTQDPDSWDKISQWRIYRWSGSMSDPGSRYDLVGATTSTGGSVTSYTDSSPDPGGAQQNYCVSAVDTQLDESSCSNTATG